MTAYVERFSPRQRLEHFVGMVLFTVLAVTGLPQKYADAGWASWLVGALGGIETVRWFHRTAGVLFSIMTAIHVGSAIATVLRGTASLSIVPTRQISPTPSPICRYHLGSIDHQARFDRFDFRQKFECWGLLMGAAVVDQHRLGAPVSNPDGVAAAGRADWWRRSHTSNERLLAFLVVVVWHIYNAHLNPDVFPFDDDLHRKISGRAPAALSIRWELSA
jgi:hypothetical protein